MVHGNEISVAIATFNGELYIKSQIESILNQTIVPNEIVIVDDLSTDNTLNVIADLQIKHSLIKVFVNDKNKGPAETFKIAITKCVFPYVALCDQDDIWKKNKLSVSLCELKKVEKIGKPCIVFSDLELIDKNNNPVASSFWEIQKFKPHNVNFRDILIGNVATGCTILMNSSMKSEIYKMPNDVTMHDHWIAITAYGIGEVGIIEEKLVLYRTHDKSFTQKDKLSYIQRFLMFIQTINDNERSYMIKNIQQAKIFFSIYENIIQDEVSKILQNFILLENKNSFFRKITIGYYKYFLKRVNKLSFNKA